MTGPRIVIEGLPEFLRALKRYAPEVRKDWNKRARGIAKVIAASAKANASWSSRIPGAIVPTATTRFVGVRVLKAKAPHGPLFERGEAGSRNAMSFRHPLFGNRAFWFQEPTRPFVQPAVEKHRGSSLKAMLEAVEEAKRGAGLN